MAALLTAGWIQLAGRDRAPADAGAISAALQRASDAWDRGDYVTALTAYQALLSGPDAAAALEPIALQTGELFRTIELTSNGANPAFSPDSRYFAFETGPACPRAWPRGSAGRPTSAPLRRPTRTSPRSTARTPASARTAAPSPSCASRFQPEITAAQAAVAAAVTTQERAPRQQALARLIARSGRIVVREICDRPGCGAEYRRPAEDGRDVRSGRHGAVRRRADAETAAMQIYAARTGDAPQPLTKGDGFKTPFKIDAGGTNAALSLPASGSVSCRHRRRRGSRWRRRRRCCYPDSAGCHT